MNKKQAKEVFERYKDKTNYFSNTIKMRDMYEMFRYRYNFGEAETKVILASLVMSGAKFENAFELEAGA